MSGYKAKRRAGEQAGRLVDTLRSMCKAAIENILEVHPVFLRVLTREHGGVTVLGRELQSSTSDLGEKVLEDREGREESGRMSAE